MEKKKRTCFHGKLRLACLGSLAALLVSFGTTWAFYSDQSVLVNPLSTSHSGVNMAEEFNPTDSFLPGEAVTKRLWFENAGDMDLFLRVEVPPTEEWVDADGLDTSYVIKGWTEAWTTEKTEINDVEEPEQKSDLWGETELWSKVFAEKDSKGTEHYYRYYRKVLPAKKSTEPILESIKLNPEVSNDRHAADYSGKTYKLTFDAQAVPVEGPGDVENGSQSLGVQAEWKMKVTLDTETGVLTWEQSN